MFCLRFLLVLFEFSLSMIFGGLIALGLFCGIMLLFVLLFGCFALLYGYLL